MKQQDPAKQKPPDTEADVFARHKELTLDAIGYISRGEPLPEELDGAIREWQATSFVMRDQQDRTAGDAWHKAYVEMETALGKAIEALSWGGGEPDSEFAASPSPFFESAFGKIELPDVPPTSSMTAPWAITPELRQRSAILNREATPLVERDGRQIISDTEGMEWDLTEYLQDLQRPEVLQRIRQSMMGSFPSDSNIASQTGGRMFELQLIQEASHALAAKLGADVPGDVRYVRTASPGFTMPWLVPLGPPQMQGIPWRGDEHELVNDPLWTRALMEVVERIDTKPTGWESFQHGLAGAAEFIGFTKGVGKIGKIGVKAAVRALPEGAALKTLAPLVMKAAPAVETLGRFPLNAPIVRTGLAMSAQTALAEATNPDVSLPDSLKRGFGEGLALGGFHKLASIGRGIATAVAGKTGLTAALLKLTPPKLGQILTSGASKTDAQVLLGRLREFSDKTFTKTLERETMAPATKESLKGVVDAYWMGVLVNAYHEAKAAPDGEGFGAFWRGIASPNAHAMGAAFALNGVLQYGASVRPAVRDYLKSPQGVDLQQRMVRELTTPDAATPLREAFDLFEKWSAAEPDVFSGADFRSPAKQEALVNKQRMAQERSAFEEQRPTDAAVTMKAMQADEPLGLTMGEFHPDKLRILLGTKAKSDAGVYKHGLNAVNEYLRAVEGAEGDAYSRWSDVPTALARRMFEWRDNNKQSPAKDPQGNLDFSRSVDETLRAVEGNPRYEGLAPIEQVAKAQATKKRPTLGRALELVATGKKDAAWLREAFPEGADHVKDGPVESWAGAFERGVRKTWKDQSTARLRKANAERAKDAPAETIQDAIAKRGGIAFVGDLENFTAKDNSRKDKRRVVYSKDSGKGMPLDDMAEYLTEIGFFPAGRPTERELIDAIFDNVHRPGNERLELQREHERNLAAADDFYRRQYRDEIESQRADIPLDDETLMEVYAGDVRFIGMEVPRLRREIEQLRAQAEAGDPGAVEAAPPMTATDHAKLATAKIQRVVHELQALDLLVMTERADSNAAMEAVARLARGEGAPEGTDPAVWSRLQEDARIARDATREAMRQSMRGTWDEGHLTELEDMWSFLDASETGKTVDPAVRDRLRNMLDDDGRLLTAYIDRMQQESAETLRSILEVKGDTNPAFYSGVPITFTGRKFTSVQENKWGRMMSFEFWLDKPEVQSFLGIPWVNRLVKFSIQALGNPVTPVLNLGPISRPQSKRQRSIMERQTLQMAKSRGDAESFRVAVAFVGPRLAAAFGGRRPPQAHLQFFSDGMESGLFASAKGPADLEAARPGTGYMWPIYERVRDTFEEIGRELVRLGRMSQEQLDKHGGGKYLAHYYVREQIEADAHEIGAGRLPMKGAGRSMMRERGLPSASEVVLPIVDPAYRVSRSAWEETQTIRAFQAIREVADDVMASLTADQLKQLGAFDRSDYVRAAVRPPAQRDGESIFDTIRRGASKGEHPSSTYNLGAKLAAALDQMAEPGKIEPGKIPYSTEGARYIKKLLGEGPEGPIFIPDPLAKELELALNDVFVLRDESGVAKLAAMADIATSFAKRGMTTLRPYNWNLNVLGNAWRNHQFGGNTVWDLMAGLAGAPSFTRDGLEGMKNYMRWIGEAAPKEKPDSWSAKEWADLQHAQRFLALAGPSTSAFVTIGPELAVSMAHAFDSPYVTRDAWNRELDARAKAGGWTKDQKDAMAMRVGEFSNRMFHGLEGVDAKILGWLGSGDPAGSAKSLNSLSSIWHMMDLFMFKYPAYLRARHEWPNEPMAKVVHYALSRTSSAMDTHPRYRRHLSMRLPLTDRVWRASQKSDMHAFAKTFASTLLRGRFWTDAATMVPMTLSSAAAHPVRTAASLAAVTGVAAAFSAMMSEDERRRWQQEAATAKQAVVDWPTLSEADIQALQEYGTSVGNAYGVDVKIPPWAAKHAAEFWQRLKWKDPAAFAAPSQAGDSRIGSLLDISPTGQTIKQFQGLGKLVGGLAHAGESEERRDQALQGVERLFGLQAQAAAQAVLGVVQAPETLAKVFEGGAQGKQNLANFLFSTLGQAGFGYPALGLFSPEGKFLGETVYLNGQTWNQHLRGIRREMNPDDAGMNLLGAGLKVLWPTRSLMQRPPLQSPVDGWSSILAEMYPGVEVSTADGMRKLAAHRWVSEQMTWLLADLYDQFIDQHPEPATAEITFDEMVAGATQEAILRVGQPAGPLGEWMVEPGYQPKTALLQAAAALPDGLRSEALGHLRAWLSRERFQEDGMTMLLEAGRRAEIPKAVFREAMKNALNDPSGTNFVRWVWSQAKDADEEKLGQLSPLIYDMQVPAEGTEAFKDYLRLMQRFTNAGLQWPPVPDTVSATEFLGKQGQQRAVQGGTAFRRVLMESPERQALDQLLMPR